MTSGGARRLDYYGRITPLIVKTVQDIAGISSAFKANFLAWLGSAQNGHRQNLRQRNHRNKRHVHPAHSCLSPTSTDATTVVISSNETIATRTICNIPQNPRDPTTTIVTRLDGRPLAEYSDPCSPSGWERSYARRPH